MAGKWRIDPLEHFPEKWLPVFRPKMRKIINLEPHFDSIKLRKALGQWSSPIEEQERHGSNGTGDNIRHRLGIRLKQIREELPAAFLTTAEQDADAPVPYRRITVNRIFLNRSTGVGQRNAFARRLAP